MPWESMAGATLPLRHPTGSVQRAGSDQHRRAGGAQAQDPVARRDHASGREPTGVHAAAGGVGSAVTAARHQVPRRFWPRTPTCARRGCRRGHPRARKRRALPAPATRTMAVVQTSTHQAAARRRRRRSTWPQQVSGLTSGRGTALNNRPPALHGSKSNIHPEELRMKIKPMFALASATLLAAAGHGWAHDGDTASGKLGSVHFKVGCNARSTPRLR